jgi:AcrR family transcriptional regulator
VPKVLSAADIAAFREKLCDIAEEKFAAHGIDAVTMRELADAMGVSPMTAYRYFKDRDAILAAVRARAFNRFADAMEKAEAADTRKGRSQAGPPYVQFALKNPAAYRMMFDTNQPLAHAYPELVAAMSRARDMMTASWRRLKACGRFTGDVELAGHLYWSAMHGVVMLELSGMLRPPMTARKLATRALAAVVRELGVAD